MSNEQKQENSVHVTIERTVQIVNYEPMKLSVGQVQTYDPETGDPVKIRQDIQKQLTKEINQFVKACNS